MSYDEILWNNFVDWFTNKFGKPTDLENEDDKSDWELFQVIAQRSTQ